jgi:hypothetical protein
MKMEGVALGHFMSAKFTYTGSIQQGWKHIRKSFFYHGVKEV